MMIVFVSKELLGLMEPAATALVILIPIPIKLAVSVET